MFDSILAIVRSAVRTVGTVVNRMPVWAFMAALVTLLLI